MVFCPTSATSESLASLLGGHPEFNRGIKPGPTWGIHGYPGDSTIKNSHFGIPQGSPGWFFKGDPTNWVQDPGDSAPNHPGSSHEIQPALLVIYGHIWQYLYIILIILQKIL